MNKKTLLIFLKIIFIISSCSKEDKCENSVDCLPPITETGKGTFGCLINGKTFIDNSGRFNCFYQYVDGKYYFNISGSFGKNEIREVNLGTIGKEIKAGEIYELKSPVDGNATASIFYMTTLETYNTNENYSGRLEITEFDLQKRIVSGTFEFEIFNSQTGEVIKIRNGRFDSLFTM